MSRKILQNAGGEPTLPALCQACCVLEKRRLLADAVDQAVGPKVRKHRMQGGHRAEDGTRHGEAHSVQQVLGLVPDTLGAAGIR